MAPDISPSPRKEPSQFQPGRNKRIEATSSKIPVPILPQGSTPSLEKIATDSEAPVNLYKRVCKSMNATIARRQYKSSFFLEKWEIDKKALLEIPSVSSSP